MLSPKDKDILNNLSFAEQMTIDNFDVVPEIGVATLLNKIARSFSVDGWAVLCLVNLSDCSFFHCLLSFTQYKK